MAEIMTSDEYNETSIGIGDYIEYRVRGDIVYSGFVVNIDRYIDVRDTNIKYYVR
jgi:nitrogenase subunit NifH